MRFPRRLRAALCGASMLAVLGLSWVVDRPLLTFYRIAGSSMLPALEDGDRVLVTTLPLLAGGIGVGDEVIARVDGETLIKRVMAGPGDTIALAEGRVLRNGLPASDPVPAAARDRCTQGALRLGSGEFFVLGDNRRVSVDSRTFGPVNRAQIVGKVVWRLKGGHGPSVTAAERP